MRSYYCECCNEIAVTKEEIKEAIWAIQLREQPVHTDNWEELLLEELFE